MSEPDLSRALAALSKRHVIDAIVEIGEKGVSPATDLDPVDHRWITVVGWGWVWTFWSESAAIAAQWPPTGSLCRMTGALQTDNASHITIVKPEFTIINEARHA